MQPDERLIRLLADREEARAAGRDPAPEDLTTDPDLRAALREADDLLRGWDALPAVASAVPTRPEGHPRYAFVEHLAAGGQGEVWRGFDRKLMQPVALKVLRRDLLGPEAKARLLEEARRQAALKHDGIVPVTDVDELPAPDGRPFVVMALVEGETLADALAARPDPRHDADRWLAVFEQVCRVVAVAHWAGVLHRDLKPSNVMLDRHGKVFVLDWGIAKALDEGGAGPGPGDSTLPGLGVAVETVPLCPRGPTATGQIKGTLAYMAPEQALGRNSAVGPATDVFGLGGLLCAVLTGRPPYEAASRPALLDRAQRADLAETFVRLDASGADREAVALAKWCLAEGPANRPADAGEVAAVVENHRLLRRLRASLPPAGPLTRFVAAALLPVGLVLLLLPHAVGAGLDMTYNLIWAATHPAGQDKVGELAVLLAGYTAGALVTTGVLTYFLMRPLDRLLGRLRRREPVTNAEAAAVRRLALRMPRIGLALSALGWLPGGVLVPALIGRFDAAVIDHFVLSFAFAGLIAMLYCALVSEYLVLRIGYLRLWHLPRDVAATVRRELGPVPGRLRFLALLAPVVPLLAALAFLVDPNPAASRPFQGVAVGLVVVGILGTLLAGAMTQYLRRVVEGFFAVLDEAGRGR